MTERILVVGHLGMLGQEVMAVAAERGEVVGLDIDSGDLSDEATARRLVTPIAADAVINCAAYTAVDRAEQDEASAHRANALLPRHLAVLCRERDIPLVHLSTDYVFSGRLERPYREDDPTGPLSAYGRTKLAGEKAIREVGGRHLIARTAWLFGPAGQNFVRTIVSLARTKPTLRVVDDQRGSPTYAPHLARALVGLLGAGAIGTIHVVGEGTCSWYELARYAVAKVGLDCEVQPCTTEEFPRPAPRPANSRLDTTLLKRLGFALPTWQEALDDYVPGHLA